MAMGSIVTYGEEILETFAQRGEQVTGTLDLTYGSGEARLLPDQWLPVGWQG